MDGVLGGLELAFLLGWIATVGIRRFVYHKPCFRRIGIIGLRKGRSRLHG